MSESAPIATHGELVSLLRDLDGLRDKGKVHPAFHFQSRAFLHFHIDEDGYYADVRFGENFERVAATTGDERAELLRRVRAHIAGHRRQ
jgi:hypothetical protein